MTVTPYKQINRSKKEEVELMFNNIAARYDFLNHLLSLGIDRGWRKKAIEMLRDEKHDHILDVATGTADFAIAAASLHPVSITGVDIASNMLEKGRKKIKEAGLSTMITLQKAEAENLPFSDNSFDSIITGFGVRNFENLEAGLTEMYRVLKPGGTSLVLEFSDPSGFPVRQLYLFYFNYLLPLVGRLVSRDRKAYSYLPESVKAFPSGNAFLEIYQNAGFINTSHVPLTFGIASIYKGKK